MGACGGEGCSSRDREFGRERERERGENELRNQGSKAHTQSPTSSSYAPPPKVSTTSQNPKWYHHQLGTIPATHESVGNISYSDHNTVSKAFPSLQT
jgi:hypothetical protein